MDPILFEQRNEARVLLRLLNQLPPVFALSCLARSPLPPQLNILLIQLLVHLSVLALDHPMAQGVRNNAVLRALPGPELARGSSCIICMEDWQTHDRVFRHKPCKNDWHADCIIRWLGTAADKSCPICRGALDRHQPVHPGNSRDYQWLEYWYQWVSDRMESESLEDFLARPGRQAQDSLRLNLPAARARRNQALQQVQNTYRAEADLLSVQFRLGEERLEMEKDVRLTRVRRRMERGLRGDHDAALTKIEEESKQELDAYCRQFQDRMALALDPTFQRAFTIEQAYREEIWTLQCQVMEARRKDPRKAEWFTPDPPKLYVKPISFVPVG